VNFLEKPFSDTTLLSGIHKALALDASAREIKDQ